MHLTYVYTCMYIYIYTPYSHASVIGGSGGGGGGGKELTIELTNKTHKRTHKIIHKRIHKRTYKPPKEKLKTKTILFTKKLRSEKYRGFM